MKCGRHTGMLGGLENRRLQSQHRVSAGVERQAPSDSVSCCVDSRLAAAYFLDLGASDKMHSANEHQPYT